MTKAIPLNNDSDCPVCETTGSFVLYDDDKMCQSCSYVPHPSDKPRLTESISQPSGRVDHEEELSWYGPDRVRMAGGYPSAYDYNDFS